MSGTIRAADCVGAFWTRFEVAWIRVGRFLLPGGLLAALVALLMAFATGTPAQAEFDTDRWAARQLKCDGFDDNRCFRYTDRRRRNKPFLQQPRRYVEEPERYIAKTTHIHKYHHYPQHYRRYADLYYGRPRHHGHHHWSRGRDRDWGRDRDRDRDWGRDRDRDRDWGRDRDRDRDWGRDRRGDRDDKWDYRSQDGRYERQCLSLITNKGAEAQTENGALISAKRAWRANVRADFGERYQDLNLAKRSEYRCWRSSTNESVVGRAGEWLTGQYRKRCQVWAVPCLGERQSLERDDDDKE